MSADFRSKKDIKDQEEELVEELGKMMDAKLEKKNKKVLKKRKFYHKLLVYATNFMVRIFGCIYIDLPLEFIVSFVLLFTINTILKVYSLPLYALVIYVLIKAIIDYPLKLFIIKWAPKVYVYSFGFIYFLTGLVALFSSMIICVQFLPINLKANNLVILAIILYLIAYRIVYDFIAKILYLRIKKIEQGEKNNE